MCGRYFQQRPPAEIAAYFQAVNPTPNLAPNWNRAPTQDGLVLRRHPETGARHLDALRWGLVPRWAKDLAIGSRMINARAESVAEKPAFREAFAKRRCFVTADGFYEWRTEGKAKQPFAIVTGEANTKLAAMHQRMPVILPREAWPAWLGEEEANAAELHDLLRPCPPEWLAAWPVSTRVNKVAENGPGLLERDPLAQPPPPGLDDPLPAFGT